jgi:hypothetical protein
VTRGVKEHFIYAVTVETPRPQQGRHTHLFSHLCKFATHGAWHSSCKQLLWKPRNPGRQGKPIYLVTFENSPPVGARNTSCTQLLRKPHDPSRKGTSIYLVTFEISRPVAARHNTCKQLLWKACDPDRQGTHISILTAETWRCGQGRHIHLRSYCGHLKNVYACGL